MFVYLQMKVNVSGKTEQKQSQGLFRMVSVFYILFIGHKLSY